MIEDADPPKTKRGWPKGKARGPRKTVVVPPREPIPAPDVPTPPPPVQQPPAAPQPQFDPSHPVDVRGSLTNGREFKFNCAEFTRENGNYVFASFPPTRGFKTLTILKILDVAAISVTAPEGSLSRLLAPVVAVPQPIPGVWAPQPNTGTAPPPQVQVNPYAAAMRETAVVPAVRLPHEAGLPMSQIPSGDDGRPTVVGATMK